MTRSLCPIVSGTTKSRNANTLKTLVLRGLWSGWQDLNLRHPVWAWCLLAETSGPYWAQNHWKMAVYCPAWLITKFPSYFSAYPSICHINQSGQYQTNWFEISISLCIEEDLRQFEKRQHLSLQIEWNYIYNLAFLRHNRSQILHDMCWKIL